MAVLEAIGLAAAADGWLAALEEDSGAIPPAKMA